MKECLPVTDVSKEPAVLNTPLCHTQRGPNSTHIYRQSLKYFRWISAGSWIRFAHPVARHLRLFRDNPALCLGDISRSSSLQKNRTDKWRT